MNNNDTKYITGCIKMSYFKNLYGRNILLIGDIHHLPNNYKDSDQHISVTNYFKKYLNTNREIIDFFVETTPVLVRKNIENGSELMKFAYEFRNCFLQKDCDRTRFHYIDRRRFDDKFSPIEDEVKYKDYLQNIPQDYRNIIIFNLLYDLYSEFENPEFQEYEEDVKNIIKDNLLTLYDLIDNVDNLKRYFLETIPEITKLNKQIDNVENKKMKDILYHTYKDKIHSCYLNLIIKEHKDFLNNITKWDDFTIKKLDIMYEEILLPLAHVNDIYTVARIFRKFRDGSIIKNAVVYTGLSHTENIFSIINKFTINQEHILISESSASNKINLNRFDIDF